MRHFLHVFDFRMLSFVKLIHYSNDDFAEVVCLFLVLERAPEHQVVVGDLLLLWSPFKAVMGNIFIVFDYE